MTPLEISLLKIHKRAVDNSLSTNHTDVEFETTLEMYAYMVGKSYAYYYKNSLEYPSDTQILKRIIDVESDDKILHDFNHKLCKYGLYETNWTGYQKVIKRIDNDYTILTKTDDEWTWYNNKDINPKYIKPLTDLIIGEINSSLYNEIENLIMVWNLDGTKTAGSLTRQIMSLIKKP